MRNVTLPLNPVQLSSLLSLCGKQNLISLGSSVHASALKISHHFTHQQTTLICNSLISVYSKCGRLPSAEKIFEETPRKDTITWNSIISACSLNNQSQQSFKHFTNMRLFGYKFDHATLTAIASICPNPRMIHCLIISSGFEQVIPVCNALITAYLNRGSSSSAQKVFDGMLDRNVITWTAMVSGMAQGQLFEESLYLFRDMLRVEEGANSLTYSSALLACSGSRALREGQEIHGLVVKSGFESDLCVESSLMDMYSKCGMMEDVCFMFDLCCEVDEVLVTVVLTGFTQNGMEERASEFFLEIVKCGMKIDATIVSTVLGAIGASAPFALGRQIHTLVIKKRLDNNVFVCNGLINMYSKCGELKDSVYIFESMAERNAVSWNSMIASLGRHGHGSEALQLFEKMELEGVKPTDVTYLSLLHACSHAGSIEKGMEFLTSMSLVQGMTPRIEHYSCVVDMLGRAGLLKEAKNFIEGLSIKPKTLLWQTLLGACGIHGDLKMGKYAAECMVIEEPNCPSAYVLLANMHSSEGKWEEREKITKKMKEIGVKKDAGVSWIEVEKDAHSFVVGDKAHPKCEVVYKVLGELIAVIREEDSTHQNSMLYGLEL